MLITDQVGTAPYTDPIREALSYPTKKRNLRETDEKNLAWSSHLRFVV